MAWRTVEKPFSALLFQVARLSTTEVVRQDKKYFRIFRPNVCSWRLYTKRQEETGQRDFLMLSQIMGGRGIGKNVAPEFVYALETEIVFLMI